jgi:predicted Zn finger-like uncharacterized protein
MTFAMIASKLACPRCRAAIVSNKPVPAGTRVRCPRCATSFTVPGPTNGQAPGPLPGVVLIRPEEPEQPSAPGRGWLAPAAVISAVLLLAGGGAAAYFTLLRGGPAPGGGGDEETPFVNVTARPQPRPLIVLTPAEEQKVQEVTGRGIEFLRRVQNPQGFWDGFQPGAHRVGVTALTGLTLLECGVKADDTAIQKAAGFLRENAPRSLATYELSLAVLFFNRLGDKQDGQRINDLALNLVAGQSPQGAWTYGCPGLTPPERDQLLGVLKELRASSREEFARNRDRWVNALPARLRNLAVLQDTEKRPPQFFNGGGDNSNTQFALLGLWAARRHGLPLEPSLALVARHFEATQLPNGAWSYSQPYSIASPTQAPTMTCAGLLGLAVGHGVAKDTKGRWGGKRTVRPAQDPAVKKALEVVRQRVGDARKDPKAPPPPMPEMYFLWSVERVAVLWRLKTIGDHHWYQWGLDMLAAQQQPDGHWKAPTGHGSCPVLDTAFALLFLQRANLAEDLTEKLQELAEMPVWGGEVAGKD